MVVSLAGTEDTVVNWFGWKGLRCSGGRLIYLSRRWQVLIADQPRLKVWRVRGFGFGLTIGRLDVVKLP